MDLKAQVRKWLEESQNIVFFGGAGVSTASGIPDFRSAGGLYQKKLGLNWSPELILSHDFIREEPEVFQDFVKEHLIIDGVQPNLVHRLLAQGEKEGRVRGVITQNIDSLHQAAGSQQVVELHGNLRDYYCPACGKDFPQAYFLEEATPVLCDLCHYPIRPRVVLYGEGLDPNSVRMARELISQADVLIIGGTSLQVYPAAGFIHEYTGDKMVLINREETFADSFAQAVFHEDLVEILGELLS